jgi:hypothetical protein
VKGPKIVGVLGRAQHGKSTLGTLLAAHFGYQPVAFADALRTMMAKLNPIVHVTGDDSKEYLRYTELLDLMGYEEAKRYPEVRRLLQVLGTEVVRDQFGENAWVDALDRTIFDDEKDEDKYVITDVRFPNEAEYVMRNKGILIKVVRPNFDNGVDSTHASEALVDTLPYDYRISNNSTIDKMRSSLQRMFQMERLYPKAEWRRGHDSSEATASS